MCQHFAAKEIGKVAGLVKKENILMTINITTVDFQFMDTNLLQALKWKERSEKVWVQATTSSANNNLTYP